MLGANQTVCAWSSSSSWLQSKLPTVRCHRMAPERNAGESSLLPSKGRFGDVMAGGASSVAQRMNCISITICRIPSAARRSVPKTCNCCVQGTTSQKGRRSCSQFGSILDRGRILGLLTEPRCCASPPPSRPLRRNRRRLSRATHVNPEEVLASPRPPRRLSG